MNIYILKVTQPDFFSVYPFQHHSEAIETAKESITDCAETDDLTMLAYTNQLKNLETVTVGDVEISIIREWMEMDD